VAKSVKAIVEEILDAAEIEINGSAQDSIQIHNPNFYKRVVQFRELGLGESYMDGWWECQAMDQMLTKLLNSDVHKRLKLSIPILWHFAKSILLNRQTLTKAAANAKFHYNIGNDLYERMLDREMVYSCAYWDGSPDLEAAQIAKMDLICRKLKLEPGMKLLDIGSGWGGFLRYTVKNYGVVGTGISPADQQIILAKEKSRGLNIEFQQLDYRKLTGKFDRIVSIGMMEHVGPKNYKTFFQKCEDLLEPNGMMLHHTITANTPTNSTNPFFDKYIFAGGILPSLTGLARSSEGKFIIEDVHNFGPDYDKTLMQWYKNINAKWSEIPQYDLRFRKMWNFYLLASAAAFRSRSIQLLQAVFRPPHAAGKYLSVR
jgi:cyclopropane-fatty-acyl-phospholipid synthase